MSKGFTLVELMVVIVISILLVTGGVISLNNYLAQEKINSASTSLVSMLSLAKNYAQTKQTPIGYMSQVDYVSIRLGIAGRLRAFPANNTNGVDLNTTYFDLFISPQSPILATLVNPDTLNFAAGTGKLVGSHGVPVDSNFSVGITISTPEVNNISRQIIINAIGQINSYAMSPDVLTFAPTPVPTSTPIPSPTPILPTPTPTPIPPSPTPTPTTIGCNTFCGIKYGSAGFCRNSCLNGTHDEGNSMCTLLQRCCCN